MATTYTVSSTSDDINDQASLRYAISQAVDGDTINFADSLSGQTIRATQTFNLTQGVIINGGGDTTISGLSADGQTQYQGSLFTVAGGTALNPVTIQNLAINDSQSMGAKGAFGNQGSQGADTSTGFGEPGGAGGPGGFGGNTAGGIYVQSGFIVLTNDSFTNNRGTGGNGGFGGSGGTGGTGPDGKGAKGAKGAGGDGGNGAGAVYVEPGATVVLASDLTVSNNVGAPGIGGAGFPPGNDGTAYVVSNSQAVRDAVVCYMTGTRILATRGEVAVEDLAVGDHLVTASGQARPIRWIGTQTLDCRDHAKPGAVLPVRIAAGALGENRPTRDLWVSPRHAICLDLLGEVLVPADALINGATIIQDSVDTVTYWHVELDSHDLLVAEGVAAESYLDIGNRGFFVGAAIAPDEEVPGGQATRAQSCRPFAEGDSAVVAFARERLRARAVALGWTAQPDPVAGLHAVADGQVIAPSVDGTTVSLRLPAGCGDVWLVSRTTVPALVGESDDRRRLGVNLRGLTIEDGGALRHTIGLDDARLGAGFHPVQGKAEAPYRWTRGKALLPAGLWADCAGPVTLRLELGGERLLRWQAPERVDAPAALRVPLTAPTASQLRLIKVA